MLLMEKIKNKGVREIYAKAAIEFTAYIIRGTIGKTIEISAL